MRIPLPVKGPCHVKPILIGKHQAIDSIYVPSKASAKVKYLCWERQLTKYLIEVAKYYLIEPHKAPNNHVGKLFYSILLKSIGIVGSLPIKCLKCLLFLHKEVIYIIKSCQNISNYYLEIFACHKS